MEATVTDVVLRDGLQDEPVVVPVAARVQIAEALVTAGVRSLEVASFVNPLRVPQMAASEELIAALPHHPGVAYRAIALNRRGVERASATRIGTLAVVISVSTEHSLANVRRDREEALADLCGAVAEADGPAQITGSVATAFCDPSGQPTEARDLLAVLDALREAGIDKVGLADTTGVAPTEHVAMLLGAVRRAMPDLELWLHLHDGRGQALDTVDAALELGVSEFDSALGGIGGCPFVAGAPGNLDTAKLVRHLHGRGIATGVEPDRLDAAARLLSSILRDAPAVPSAAA
ncbi:MAG TPA: hypothetical protein VFN36_01760 [Solirubrobacteraceae bacterium]|nr:hypothetical protein [Solirubrobacteraceae bacterium]